MKLQKLNNFSLNEQQKNFDIFNNSNEELSALIGYNAFHSRLNDVWIKNPPIGEPAIEELQFPRELIRDQLKDIPGRSIEAKWIGYIIHHIVGNSPNEAGYRAFHTRLSDVWMQRPPVGMPAMIELLFPRGSIMDQLRDVPGRSIEAKWIGYIVHHIVGNPPDEAGYRAFHTRLNDVWRQNPPIGEPAIKELQFPRGSIENQLKDIPGRSVEAKWIGYIIHHIVGNDPVIL